MPNENGEHEHGQTHRQQTQMREALQRIIEPVRREVEAIDQRLTVIEAERADLMTARREALAVIRAAEPREYGKPGPKAKTNSHVAEETRTALIEFLRVHANEFPEGFNVRALSDDPRLNLNKTTIARALPELADEGVLRLDRLGYLGEHKTGRESRIYKAVELGGE